MIDVFETDIVRYYLRYQHFLGPYLTNFNMSRHRDIRNLDADDFDDEMDSYGSSYGSSYMDETTLSKSMERYVYNRGVPGGTPKMGHFVLGRSDSVPSVPEEDSEDVDGAGAR